MEFVTRLDFTTRQVKQSSETFSILSGGTKFGVPFNNLQTGPDLLSTGVTSTINGVVSTFSGNSSISVFTWYDTVMDLAKAGISAITSSNSGTTQYAGPSFTSNTTTTIDGNTVVLTYSGVSFDITPTSVISLGGGAYSGTVNTNTLSYLSAGTLDYTGRTIWVDVSGITRTERLIITNLGAGPGTFDVGIDANGFLVNNASDVKLKENINTIDNALTKVLNLRGVTYNWKDKISGGDSLKIGFIAQEVSSVVPELTYQNGEYMGVHYKDITALLVEAIKEIISGNTTINVSRDNLNTQTVVAEDNNIELNYNGNHQTSINGGIIVLHAIQDNINAEFVTDSTGCWTTNTDIKPSGLVIPSYTPTSSSDITGNIGNITKDDDYLYVKTSNGWKRVNMENF